MLMYYENFWKNQSQNFAKQLSFQISLEKTFWSTSFLGSTFTCLKSTMETLEQSAQS